MGDTGKNRKTKLIALGFDNFFAAIVAGWADMVTQMSFACRWLYGQRRCGQKVMGAMHAAF
jgi:hypothetical protein